MLGRKGPAGNILPHEAMMRPLLPFFKIQKVTFLEKKKKEGQYPVRKSWSPSEGEALERLQVTIYPEAYFGDVLVCILC